MSDEEDPVEPKYTDDYDSDEEEEKDEESEDDDEDEPELKDLFIFSSSSESSSDSEYDSDDSIENIEYLPDPNDKNTPEDNIAQFEEVLNSKSYVRRRERELEEAKSIEEMFDFPKDPENWQEADLRELWADGPRKLNKQGWDPVWADAEDWKIINEEIKEGRDPPIAPFYLPYRKNYPVIPDNHYDIKTPKAVIEELDRIEEFLKWVSYIFPDGSSYEGTVWDDLAHGKGVYVAEEGLVRYEGEWLRNNMEGHGVVEVDIPDVEPMPGSELEEKMRAEGKIIERDYMSPEDREWLEMDMEDSYKLAAGQVEIPFYEGNEWVKQFGSKPEKGRYKYAGQWKHGRMHGCGVYEVNERPIFGRFYFGELVEEDYGECNHENSTLHAGIAEVAAAKARMFVNKPDGMVREERGPYNDPQHPYLYEGEDVWMAPGFINQFCEVPDPWKVYVHEVDQEREMWLNSFYKSPLRIPMPAELEYWWQKQEDPEFIILKKEPEPDPEDPTKLVYTEDPLILHTKTGRLINFVEDEEHGIRLFWQPPLKEGEEVDPEKAEFLPLGFDEFYGRVQETEGKGILYNLITAVENVMSPVVEKLEKWSEQRKKQGEMKLKLIEKELEFIEAELCLEEAIEDMEAELEMEQKEEESKTETQQEEEEKETKVDSSSSSGPVDQEEEEEDGEEEEEDDDDGAPASFGSVIDQDKGRNKTGKSPFAATSLSFTSTSILSMVPAKLSQSFQSWKNGRRATTSTPPEPLNSVRLRQEVVKCGSLKVASKKQVMTCRKTSANVTPLHSLSRVLWRRGHLSSESHHCDEVMPEMQCRGILSMSLAIHCSEDYFGE